MARGRSDRGWSWAALRSLHTVNGTGEWMQQVLHCTYEQVRTCMLTAQTLDSTYMGRWWCHLWTGCAFPRFWPWSAWAHAPRPSAGWRPSPSAPGSLTRALWMSGHRKREFLSFYTNWHNHSFKATPQFSPLKTRWTILNDSWIAMRRMKRQPVSSVWADWKSIFSQEVRNQVIIYQVSGIPSI